MAVLILGMACAPAYAAETTSGPASPPVLPAAGAPVITSATTAAVRVGTYFSYYITATNSPTSYGASNLPAGVVFTYPSIGFISGTPTGPSTTAMVTISATNAAGTGTAQLALTIDGTPPALTVTPVTTPSATNRPVITGTTDDPAATITVVDNTTLLPTTVATKTNAGVNWSATCAALSDGSRTLKVTATDAVGNATTSAAIPVVVDTTGPVVTIAPLGTTGLTVSYSDATTAVAAITLSAADVKITKVSGDAVATAAVSGSGLSTRTITFPSFSGNGQIQVTVAGGTATDAVGNPASAPFLSATFDITSQQVSTPVVMPIANPAVYAGAGGGGGSKKCGIGGGLGLVILAGAFAWLALRRNQ